MRATLNLLRLQIDNHTDLLKTASPRKMVVAAIKILLLLAAITAGLAYGFMRIFLLGFSINAELIALLLLIVQALTLVFTVARVIGTLYLSHDNELLICLPVTANQFFVSKILLVYFKEFAFNAMLCLPLFLCLGFFGGLGVSFYCAIPLYLILMPILPIILASFLSIPVMRVLAFLKRHSVLAIIVLLVSVAGVLWAYLSLIAGLAGSFNIVEQQMQLVSSINEIVRAIGGKIVIYYQLALAMFSFSKWYYIPLFLLLCALLSFATVMVIRPFYFRIAMPQLENRITVRSKKKEREFRLTSPFVSLIKKEMLCIFRSPSEVFEYFLFTLLMPFIVVSYDRLLMTVTVNQAGVNMIAGSHVMIVAILAMLSNISSASAISRDGANFHASKIIPVDYFTQIFAKLTFNAIFTVGAVILTAIISVFSYPVWQIALGSLAVSVAAIGHIALCLEMDIKHPSVAIQGDEESSTTSKSTPYALLSGLVIGFLMGLFLIMQSTAKVAVLPYILLIAIALIFALWRVWHLILRVQLAYDKIEM
ncbi:MAG: hypothetical protein IJB94_02565 [Clostridia bacterium]|nr:hypothetical protein [Clostridia bacterium]